MSLGAVGKPLIFVSDGFATVNIYLQAGNHPLVGWITNLSQPVGLATDVAGNLYIAAGSVGNATVLVYAPPYTSGPKLQLQNVGAFPLGVAVSPQGVVAVAGGAGFTFYAAGSPVPCAAITAFYNNYYDAFDDKGNLFVDGANASNFGLLGVISGGCHATSVIPLSTGNTIGAPVGIQIDKADRIAIQDYSNPVIYTYNRPKNGSLGNPMSTTPLTNSPGAATFTFLASGCGIWVADANGRASNYDYPTGGVSEQTIVGGGFPYGIAVTPPLLP